MKRTSDFLMLRKSQYRAALERHLGDAVERLACEGQRTFRRYPLASVGAAGLSSWLATLLAAGRARGLPVAGVMGALKGASFLRRFL